jgi:hypothetical protein
LLENPLKTKQRPNRVRGKTAHTSAAYEVRKDPCECENVPLDFHKSEPGSVVGIATAYWLDGPGIESRWGEIFRISPDRP